ncbi:unnamed protein product [Allacma fusca]|uniref:Ubiquitin-like domain-containing protein n=1 Tax=Allacma fusca TaxID=39272 RepID=A0A8J2PTY0_9HEXA|nr:unnamed protein product [Allacma fusca]
MKITPTIQSFVFKDKRNKDETFQFQGRLLFCWPYKWEKDIHIWQELIDNLKSDISDYFARRINPLGLIRLKALIEDSIVLGLFSTPSAWRKSALEDPLTYKKCLLYCAYVVVLYCLDDKGEKFNGNLFHGIYFKNMGYLFQQLFRLDFESTDLIEQDPFFVNLQEVPGFQSTFIYLMFDIVQDMKSTFCLTPSKMNYLAKAVRSQFEFKTWFRSTKMSHNLQKDLRDELRGITVGYDVLTEFWMVLDGIFPGESIRSSVYWNRMLRNARRLCYMVNDIFSLPKEYEEFKTGSRMDNGILLSMEVEQLTINKALEIKIQEHNHLLKSFYDDAKCLLQDQTFLFDQSKEDQELFFVMLECLGTTLSHIEVIFVVILTFLVFGLPFTIFSSKKKTSKMVSATHSKLKKWDGMRRTMPAQISTDHVVKIPRFGTTFSIRAVEKSGETTKVPIFPSNKPNKFLAVFETDDVDFEIVVDNRKCGSRHVIYELKVHNKIANIVVDKSRSCNFRALEKNGRKIHFLRGSSEEGETCVATFASKHDLAFKEASRILSQLQFEVGYSNPISDKAMGVVINGFTETFVLEVLPTNTVNDLKTKIEKCQGIKVSEQRLIFEGKLLTDNTALMDYEIKDQSVVYVIRKLQGGNGTRDSTSEEEIYSESDSDSTDDLPRQGRSNMGKRGVIVFGDPSDQTFVKFPCDKDESMGVSKFVIEVRRANRFGFYD